ncbi:hypothetical protein B0T26DRAFT_635882 [Lasiosphaeria miniovina]|uniref:Uncharacterized protein n=1 Tax=Lasiosphaeria miniovina TaxID=1954250 RepID=A0AA40BHU0_9PEZI|nr:uncharacterized protein B0T26DRAFT_635882 [Lasiosphaeria miniovina]KAK0734514.1 hypothetical protein B0T26DRAFT_635882 [Lasiosphaeria miniovina]
MTAHARSMQHVAWHPVPNPSELKSGMPPSLDLLVALWRTEQPGRAADELSNITTTKLGLRPRRNQQQPAASASAAPTPLIHIPQCRLEITSGDELLPIGASSASFSGGMLERVALPKSLVQPFLSRLPLPHGVSAGAPHFDDDDEWVYSRCLLSDFTEMGEEGAAVLSQQGRLCCWASVVLMRYAVDGGGHDNTEAHWDLGFIVHRVLTRRDPDTTLCPCVLGE